MNLINLCIPFTLFLWHVEGSLIRGLYDVEEFEINDLLTLKYYNHCHLDPIQSEKVLASRTSTSTLVHPLTSKDVKFLFYSRKNPVKPQVILGDEPSSKIASLEIDLSKEIVVFCNGYDLSYIPANIIFPLALLPQKDLNIIITDWNSYDYKNIVYTTNITTPRLGNVIGGFLKKLITFGADPKKITLVGFSAGSQALALAAKQIIPKIARIIAYSPDGTCFDFQPDSQRLVRGDADFVVIVHCSTGYFEYTLKHLGDVTFYVNGGVLQPYCIFVPGAATRNLCSHLTCMSYLYFSLLNSDRVRGVRCQSYWDYKQDKCDCGVTAPLIYDISNSTTGLYFIDTEFSQNKPCQ